MRAGKVLIVLQAFIDDSASDSRHDRRLFLAGYLATVDVWERFSDDWAAVLSQPPVLRSLHMSGSWAGFTAAQKEAKIDALVGVLAKYRPLSIECSISQRDYVEIVRPNAPYDLRHPYFTCFMGILNGVSKLLYDEGLDGPVDLIFDEQGNVGTNAAIWYEVIKQMIPGLAGNLGGQPIFRKDEDMIPLQAADLLAWHVRRLGESGRTLHQLQTANAIRFRHRYLDIPRPLLEKWAEAFSKTRGIEAAKHKSGSIKHSVARTVSSVPPEHLIPTMEAMAARGERLLILKESLERLGLRRVWKWVAKRLRVRR
jgi:hypothetical protein